MSAKDRQEKIISELNEFKDGFERYSYLIELACMLPAMPDSMHTDDRLVRGCQSHVWIDTSLNSDGLILLQADSDTLIIKGILFLLLYIVNNSTPSEFFSLKLDFMQRGQLMQEFSDERQKGINYIIENLRQMSSNLEKRIY